MTALVSRPLKAVAHGDSALIMWLSLNLILLVFFMLLNSMAIPGTPQENAAMAQANREATLPAADARETAGAAAAAWREGVITRLRGTIPNRLELNVLPQASNASALQVEIPLAEVFRDDGALRRPELVHTLLAAAGADSDVAWSLHTPYAASAETGKRMATLSRMTKSVVAWEESDSRMLRVSIRPGTQATPAMGVRVQEAGEAAGGHVSGVDTREAP